MAMAYFRRAAADNVVHAEIFFDPQTHTARGVAIGDRDRGPAPRHARAAERELGLSTRADPVLPAPPERRRRARDARAGAAVSRPLHRRRPRQRERGHPPEKFARVFARAGELGLHRVAHAGEEGPPAYIDEALDVLHVERIDHGVRCLEDPALVARLARRADAADGLPALERQAVRLRRHGRAHARRAARARASARPSTPTTRRTSAATSTTTSSPPSPRCRSSTRATRTRSRPTASRPASPSAAAKRAWRERLDAVFAG